MKETVIRTGASLALAWLLLANPAGAQDFQRAYALGPGGIIKIWNISGNIIVKGHSADTVVVTATRSGRDRDRIEIEDKSTDGRVEVGIRYPESGDCHASVDFAVRVPSSKPFNFERLSSVSGNVELDGISGRIKAQSVSGSVVVKNTAGTVSASAVSGSVDVHLNRIEGLGDMRFSSVSGRVTVRAPRELAANVAMSTVSGSLETDFPIEVIVRRYGPGRSARGKLGEGSRSIRITSVSGRVMLIRS